MIPGTHYSKKIYVRWSDPKDPPGERVLWITEGDSKDDFYGSTVAVDERNVGKLLSELKVLLEKPCRLRKLKS